jgi:hypothetical protein
VEPIVISVPPTIQVNQIQRLIFPFPKDLIPQTYGKPVSGENVFFDVYRQGEWVQTYKIQKLSSYSAEFEKGVILVESKCRHDECSKVVEGRMPFTLHNGQWWTCRLPNCHCIEHATGGGTGYNSYRVRVDRTVFWQSPALDK